ncbi:prephenate dehydratase [Enterococcus sp. PF1-24]|uniref:prephenate dehydratase n=1 Tax=unclassified Enterococcus TaxID=2608891 RepID=UPI002475145F|nr:MULTISPECIES: prephenate dehydratase [unclassified Enterococcus]MDH6364186.1 prephenate dehydratase [Enterococcus sp. PFB1-1]MDH6401287.1 prephenate dehydratase [Enterococcus sp. PF1-24]
MKIGYLGPESSFTHRAAMTAFPTETLIAYPSIPACIKAVEYEEVILAVVPIENTIEGSVNTTLDYLFHQADLTVGAEIVLPIHQYLMVAPEHQDNWQQLEKIISHPQALAQCRKFIEEHFDEIEIEQAPSTTYGANYVQLNRQRNIGAIAAKQAAEKYGLKIVAENIQDIEINRTRFWVIGGKNMTLPLPVSMEKISLAITMPYNQPGSLHKALSAFGWREIDLSKIESRPLKTSLGEYFFLIDINVEKPMALIENALEEIRLLGGEIKIFGHYPVHLISE